MQTLKALLFAAGLWSAVTGEAATLLVANKSAASVTLYQLPEGRAVATLPTGQGPHEVAVSPDGRQALVTNYGIAGAPGASLTLVDIAAARVLKTLVLPKASKPHGVEWIDGQRAVVTAEGIDSVLRVAVTQGAVDPSVRVDQRVVHMLTVDPVSQRVFTANIGSGTSSVIDLAAATKVTDMTAGDGSEGLALIGGELWVSNRSADTVTVHDTQTLERIATLPLAGFPIRVEPDMTRQCVYVTLPAKDQIAVIDVRERAVLRRYTFDVPLDETRKSLLADRIPDSSIPIGVLLSGDGTQLFVAHSASHVVTVWDPDTFTQLNTIATGIEPDGMAWSAIDVITD